MAFLSNEGTLSQEHQMGQQQFRCVGLAGLYPQGFLDGFSSTSLVLATSSEWDWTLLIIITPSVPCECHVCRCMLCFLCSRAVHSMQIMVGNNRLEQNSTGSQMLGKHSKARVAELAILTTLQSCHHPASQNTVLVVWVLSKSCLKGHQPMQLCTAVAHRGGCHQHRHNCVLQHGAQMGPGRGRFTGHFTAVK